MPLSRKVAYSKLVSTPSGKQTLGLFDKDNKFIEYRVCLEKPDGTYECPKLATDPKKRLQYAKILCNIIFQVLATNTSNLPL